MDPASLIGLVLVLVGTFVGMIMKGVSPGAMFAVPAALLIVIVASLGATVMGGTMADLKNAAKVFKKALLSKKAPDPNIAISKLVEFADGARKDGLLSLEDEIKNIDDDFMRNGLQMAVDGTDPEVVREAMEADVAAMKQRHKGGAKFMTNMGVFSPTFGIIGAVVGLIATLSHLDDPDKLGEGIAAAFVATFWGVFAANGIFLPIANKLTKMSSDEVAYKELIIEGVLSVQAGASPRHVEAVLLAYLPPKKRTLSKGEERKSA